MNEIAELADDCSVFRNGRHVATFAAGSQSDAETVEMMIGRDIAHAFPPKPPARTAARRRRPRSRCAACPGAAGCTTSGWPCAPGEIVGLGGLDGQGQREFFLALFGVLRGVSGEVRQGGEPVAVAQPAPGQAPRLGIALVPEDRKTDGLMLPMSVRDNLSFAALDRLSRAGVVIAARGGRGRRRRWCAGCRSRRPRLGEPVATLSGGNQQKVVIAKWLMNAPRIVLLSDPTRGIDVGTKQEIYVLLRRLADEGAAVLLYSTDYAELIGCCDRVAVFFDGRIVRWLAGAELTEHALVASALNLDGGDACTDARRLALPVARAARHLRTAAALFVLIFALYIAKHQTGWTVPVLTTAANKGVLLAIVAMAQTLPVLTSGIDLSVGMVFVLANCLASHLVVGTPLQAAAGVLACSRPARCAAGSTARSSSTAGCSRSSRRWPPARSTSASRWACGRCRAATSMPELADALTGRAAGRRAGDAGGAARGGRAGLGAVPPVGGRPRRAWRSGRRRRRPTCRAWTSAAPSSSTYTLAGLLAAIGGLLLTFVTYSGEASSAIGGVYTLNSIAAVVIGGTSLVGRRGQRDRLDVRRAGAAHHRRPAVRVRSRAALAAAVPGRHPAGRGEPRGAAAAEGRQPARPLQMTPPS